VGGNVMQDGRRLGTMRLASVTRSVVDKLYEKLLKVIEVDVDGDTFERERRPTVNHAMKTCRRAWNVVKRRHGSRIPENPFAKMGLESSDRETPTASYGELQAFRAPAMDRPAIARHGRSDRLGMAPARNGVLRQLRDRSLPPKGTAKRGSRLA
jgi:hypothetical protein